MFEQQLAPPPNQRVLVYGAFSIAVHVVVIGLIVLVGPAKVAQRIKEVGVKFVAPVAMAPPPPPPPAGSRTKPHPHVTKKIVSAKVQIPKKVEPVKEPEPEEPDEAVVGGVVGGVKGGVVGGTVGGVVGGTLGGTGKAKNVPPFVIQRDVLSQPAPHMSEVFKLAHRGRGAISGMYKICVGTDGHVYEVTPLKSVPGADQEIIAAVRNWMYKPQQVPVCFLYNMPISIQ